MEYYPDKSEKFFMDETQVYEGFASEKIYQGYLAELEIAKRKKAARSNDAVRQGKIHKQRRAAKNYFEVWLRTGSRPLTWLVKEDGSRISKGILKKALADAAKKFPEYAKLRGLKV